MCASRSLYTLVAVVVVVGCASAKQIRLPSDIPLCQVDAPDFDDCVAKAIEVALPKLKNGDANVGIPVIDPLHVDNALLDLRGGAIPLLINGSNMEFIGLSASKIKESKMDTKNYKLTATTFTPTIKINFDYTATGKILLLNIAGDGKAFIQLDDVTVEHEVMGKAKDKKGKTYWEVATHNVKITPMAMKCNFENLFKGDQRVNAQVNKFLNDEWKTFWEQIKPGAEGIFNEVLQAVTARVFDRVAYKDIFLGA